jgi:hypothetical protein
VAGAFDLRRRAGDGPGFLESIARGIAAGLGARFVRGFEPHVPRSVDRDIRRAVDLAVRREPSVADVRDRGRSASNE